MQIKAEWKEILTRWTTWYFLLFLWTDKKKLATAPISRQNHQRTVAAAIVGLPQEVWCTCTATAWWCCICAGCCCLGRQVPYTCNRCSCTLPFCYFSSTKFEEKPCCLGTVSTAGPCWCWVAALGISLARILPMLTSPSFVTRDFCTQTRLVLDFFL